MMFIFKFLFKLNGWKIKGGIPPDVKKCVLVAAPHTSNWDFVYGLAAIAYYGYKTRYLIKSQAYRFPLKRLIDRTGGIAVDRSKHNNLVDALVEEFNKRSELILMVPPEGTRKLVQKWKTGFYYTALNAKVPILLGYLDYKNKIASIDTLLWPTGDREADFKKIRDFYKDIVGKHPENFSINSIC
ncbi:MAG: 1-acyl-sn-glycerol-3-phosphate acyltransferase [Bacteroidia bacterium]|nr:1-acyl-sn-glycerol-3-phosphate acyltransferase [Bacteroidia bacterium]